MKKEDVLQQCDLVFAHSRQQRERGSTASTCPDNEGSASKSKTQVGESLAPNAQANVQPYSAHTGHHGVKETVIMTEIKQAVADLEQQGLIRKTGELRKSRAGDWEPVYVVTSVSLWLEQAGLVEDFRNYLASVDEVRDRQCGAKGSSTNHDGCMNSVLETRQQTMKTALKTLEADLQDVRPGLARQLQPLARLIAEHGIPNGMEVDRALHALGESAYRGMTDLVAQITLSCGFDVIQDKDVSDEFRAIMLRTAFAIADELLGTHAVESVQPASPSIN